MAKKILGGIMIFFAIALIIGSFAPGNTVNVLTVIATILFAATGVFLITFDGGARIDYYTGYNRRRIQNVIHWILFVPFLILFMLTTFSFGIMIAGLISQPILIILVVGSLILFLFPTMVLGMMLAIYFAPYQACKKHIPCYASLIDKNLVIQKNLTVCSKDKSVLANDTVIFFPKQYCVIPFDMIESYKYSNPLKIEPDVFLKLKNGKTILIVNKNFDVIKDVIDAHTNNQ